MRASERIGPFALAAALLLGCGGGAEGSGRPTSTTDTPAASATTPATGFSVTDTAWLQLAIAMDERALTVLTLAPARVRDATVRELAERLAAEHRAELARLHALYARSGGPTANPHEGHDMPGMATAQTVAALERATGADAVHIVTTAIRAHLDQSIRLAQAEQKSGTAPEAKALAADLERSRTAQRGRLDAL